MQFCCQSLGWTTGGSRDVFAYRSRFPRPGQRQWTAVLILLVPEARWLLLRLICQFILLGHLVSSALLSLTVHTADSFQTTSSGCRVCSLSVDRRPLSKYSVPCMCRVKRCIVRLYRLWMSRTKHTPLPIELTNSQISIPLLLQSLVITP